MNEIPVGADLSAKAEVQTTEIRPLIRPFRGQVRSHNVDVAHEIETRRKSYCALPGYNTR
jgi:hypothetical protein